MARKPKVKSQKHAGVEIPGVDLGEVEHLLAFMDRHNLEEFEYQRGSVHFRLKKATVHAVARAAVPPAVKVPVAAAPAAAPTSTAKHAEAAESADLHIVRSPIVGTFYSAPSPGSEPFVKGGARVATGQVLCIIEAMKLMNEIESDVAGEIVKVFVESGHPVEYGEPLFGIQPGGQK